MSMLLLSGCSGIPVKPPPLAEIGINERAHHITVKAKDESIVLFIYRADTIPVPLDTLLKYYYLYKKKIK